MRRVRPARFARLDGVEEPEQAAGRDGVEGLERRRGLQRCQVSVFACVCAFILLVCCCFFFAVGPSLLLIPRVLEGTTGDVADAVDQEEDDVGRGLRERRRGRRGGGGRSRRRRRRRRNAISQTHPFFSSFALYPSLSLSLEKSSTPSDEQRPTKQERCDSQ